MKKNTKIIFSIFFIITLFFGVIFISFGEKNKEDEFLNLFQEEIDKTFPKIDKKMCKYLLNLQTQKNYCFGPDKKMPFTKCVDELEQQLGISGPYAMIYTKACDKALENTIKKQEKQTIGSKTSLDITDNINGICHKIIAQKLDFYKTVGYRILKENKYNVLKDETKKLTQKDRTKYSKVLDLAKNVLGNMERMKDKWPSKTKKHVF